MTTPAPESKLRDLRRLVELQRGPLTRDQIAEQIDLDNLLFPVSGQVEHPRGLHKEGTSDFTLPSGMFSRGVRA